MLLDERNDKARAYIEAALPADGLYRISSGQRVGRLGKMFRQGDDWAMVGEGVTAPVGATLVDVRSTTLADAYVVRGKPGAQGALKPRRTALGLQPLGDPTALAPGAKADFAILFDGRPITGATESLFREMGFYDGRKQVAEIKSDAGGKVSFTLPGTCGTADRRDR